MKHTKNSLAACAGLFSLNLLAPVAAPAAVTVSPGLAPASPWPAEVTIDTGDPAQATTGVSVSSTHRASQTFTPSADGSLDAIYFTYSTAVTSGSNSFSLRLQAVSEGSAAQTYAQAADLLPSGSAAFTLASTSGTVRQLKFAFTGSDRVMLQQGVTYAVEISSASSTLSLYRRGASTYAEGNYYDNRQAFNYPSTRDLAMGVAALPPPPVVEIILPTMDPTFSSESSVVSLSGTASATASAVVWKNAANSTSGTASGITAWTVPSISLASGTNVITVTGTDSHGGSGSDTVTVTYAAPTPTPTPPPSGNIAVTEGITPSTAWPEAVQIQTGDPAANTTAASVTAATMESQTFTPSSNLTLQTIYLTYSTSAASAANSFSLRLQTVTSGSSATTYTQGPSLLPAFSFSLDSTGGTVKIIKFTFSGSARVALAQGTTYAFEVISSASNLSFYRRGADAYSGGALYLNRSAFNTPDTRDLALAVVGSGTAIPTPTPTPSPNGVAVTEFPGAATEWPEPFNIITDIPDGVTSTASVNPSTVLSQTFTPGRNFNLGSIYLLYSTNAASAANSFSVKIQPVSGGPAVQTYAQATNLLPATATFSLGNTAGVMKILKIGFNGTCQIPLTQDTTYALEISSTASSATFYRRGSDPYSGGALYLNRSAFNYPSTRDLAMGVIKAGGADMGTGGVGGNTFLPVPQMFSIQMLDGNASTEAEKNLVAAGGYKFFRKGVYWSRVEQSMGIYNFTVSNYDTLINGLSSRGLQPYLTLFDGNSVWGETQRSVRSSTGRTAFANFAKAAAIHYPAVRYFELWNEPNLAFFWSPQPSIADYCALAATVSPEIKTVTPTAKVVGPALAGPHIAFDWLEQVFKQGLLANLDCIAVHPYRDGDLPPETVLTEYKQIRAYVQQYAPAGKQIEILAGEWGYHTDNTANAVTEAVQAQYVARMYLIHLSIGMPFANMYSWKDGTTDVNSNDHYGMLRPDGTVKPAYNAVKTLATVLSGYTFQQRVAQANPAVFVMKFTNASGKLGYAIWTTGANISVPVTLPAGSGTLNSIFGVTQAISWSSSGPQITATTSPQYLIVN